MARRFLLSAFIGIHLIGITLSAWGGAEGWFASFGLAPRWSMFHTVRKWHRTYAFELERKDGSRTVWEERDLEAMGISGRMGKHRFTRWLHAAWEPEPEERVRDSARFVARNLAKTGSDPVRVRMIARRHPIPQLPGSVEDRTLSSGLNKIMWTYDLEKGRRQ